MTLRRRIAAGRWPVFFAFSTLSYGAVTGLLAVVMRSDVFAGMAVTSPLWGAAMTAALLSVRRRHQEATGLSAGGVYDIQLALTRGTAPADRAQWPAARALIERQRAAAGRLVPRITLAYLVLAGVIAAVGALLALFRGAGMLVATLPAAAALIVLAVVTRALAARQARRFAAAARAMGAG